MRQRGFDTLAYTLNGPRGGQHGGGGGGGAESAVYNVRIHTDIGKDDDNGLVVDDFLR